MIFSGKTIGVCVTGGIAAYKACEIVSLLKKKGACVHVIMTQNATEFVTPLTFETLSGNKVVLRNFDPDREWEVEHVSLAKKCDLFIIAPCTANVVGKLASGIADDFLTTCVMAAKKPVLIAPAMNVNMYESAAYKENEATLTRRGFYFVEPDVGLLACGDTGKGRLADPKAIVARAEELLKLRCDLIGKTVLVTLGATREKIDPVRFITNASSGKMGMAIIKAALSRGATVKAVVGFIDVEPVEGVEYVKVTTTEEMLESVMRLRIGADYVIMAAAPADYGTEYRSSKIKDEQLTLKLRKNPDIAACVGKDKAGAKLVVFAAETDNLIENAKLKLQRKNADLVVANDVTEKGAGFYTDTNIATLITGDEVLPLPIMSKDALADIILDKILNVR